MTQKYEIKNHFTEEVIFSYDIPDEMRLGMIARHAVEAAIAADADLRGANLSGADLRVADLSGAKAAPLIIYGLQWDVIISGTGKMRIGCQEHSVDAWKDFDDERISKMDSNALEFWDKYKTMLLASCATHVHEKESEA